MGFGVWGLVGANAFDRGSSLTTDVNGNVYLTGNFSGLNVNFNPGGSDLHSSAANGSEYDIYVTKINANGTYGWTRVLGGKIFFRGPGILIGSGRQ